VVLRKEIEQMGDQNIVAARLGLPFKCGVCSQVHEKADLNNKDVCRCLAKAWRYALGYDTKWFSKNGGEIINRPTFQIDISECFNLPKIHYSYPFENDVFMLSFSIEKIAKTLSNKFREWKYDSLRNGIRLIEEKGKLKKVCVRDGKLFINGKVCFYNSTLISLMIKSEDVAAALKMICCHSILDVEWKSFKESAKLLVESWNPEAKFTVFASEKTGVIQVPNEIDSILKAENYLMSGGQPCGKVTATEFPIQSKS
jgi:hypothetical protein